MENLGNSAQVRALRTVISTGTRAGGLAILSPVVRNRLAQKAFSKVEISKLLRAAPMRGKGGRMGQGLRGNLHRGVVTTVAFADPPGSSEAGMALGIIQPVEKERGDLSTPPPKNWLSTAPGRRHGFV